MEAKNLKWKTTKEELPPNETLDALEKLLVSLKNTKSQLKQQVNEMKEQSESKEK